MKKQSRILAFLLTLTMLVSMIPQTFSLISSAAESKRSVSDLIQKELKLTYDEPAPDDDNRDPAFSKSKLTGWEVWALPLGNAYAGAKVFGITERERIQINENTLSTSGSTSNSGTTNFTETYVHFNHDYDNVTNYNRDLILNDSTSHVSYDYNGVTYTREYFASYPDGVIVLKFDASGEKNLDFTLEPKIPYYNYEYKYGYTYDGEDHDPADVKAELLDDGTALITLEGYLPGINDNGNGTFSTGYGMYFEGQFKVFTDGTLSVAHSGGSVDSVDEYSNGTVTVSDASTAYVIIALGTNYELDAKVFTGANNTKLDGFAHPHDKVSATIAAASEKSYDELRKAHVADYSELFSRVALDLGGDPGDLTTDELLANYKANDKNAYVEELLFAYGRYLLISSSRDGALPPNLNGIWNRYHSTICMNGYWGNINIQMNYWSTFNTNLAECFSAYLGYYSAYAEANHKNAIYELKNKGYITSSGDVEGDLWSVATAHTPFLAGASFGGRDGWGNTPFMAEIFWDYYDYTGDKELLEQTVFPAILACANFLSYVMQETEDGLYLSTSSGSPEQSTTDPYHTYVTSHPGYEPVGTGYDQSLTYSNYLHVLEAVEILGYTDQKLEELGILGIINRIRTQVDKLDPVAIGYSGQVKEFREEYYYGEIGEPEHRHISHLCALVQGSIFNEAEAAAWLDAARVTMENRGSNKPYGWEAVMKIYSWARIRENEKAYKNLEFLINTCLGYNMMTLLSNAFQVEANLGAPAAMSDMLLQSHEGFIAPLAALPSAWADGAYSGLVARGGFEVGAAWTDGFADEFVIVSNNGGKCTVKYINIATATVKDQNGKTVSFTKNGSDFITFDTEAGSTYTITDITEGEATEKPGALAVEYDVDGAHLAWAASANAASYNVYRSANSESSYTLMASGVKATDYVIDNTDFNPSNQYTYAVSAVSASGRESARAHATMIPILAPNEAKGLLVGNELTVYISEVAGNEINYRIYEEKGGVRKLAHETSYLTAVLANASKDSIYTVVSVINGIESAEFVTVNVEEKVDGPYKVDSNNLFLNKDIRIVQNEKYTIDGTEYTSGPHTTGSASYPLSNVVDNNPALESRWAIANTNYAHPLMVEIDCENSCELGMLTITAYKLYNPCILILASVDGETWTTAAMKYDEKLINCAYGSAIQIDLTGTTARYVRIVFNATAETDNGYTAAASVCEIACPGSVIIEQTPSKLELQKAIENAEAIDSETIAAIAPDFLGVLKDAIAIFENESASKSKIDEAVVTLNAAAGDLKSAEQLVSDSANKNYGNFTFEFDEDGSGKYMTSSPDREAIPAWSVSFAGQPINAVTESDLDNRYLSFVYQSGSAALTNTAYWEILTSDWYAKFSKYKNGEIDDFLYSGSTYDYAVFDMDFTTHQYVYTTADGKIETGVTVPEGATDVKLAYPEGAMIYPIFRSYAIGATEAMQSYTRMKLVSENGKWYITRNTGDDGRLISENPKDKIELKEGIGEWNHVTTVIKTNQSSLKDSQIHIFVNGELIAVYRPTNSSIEKFNFASYRIDFTKDTIGATPFELDIDNITTNLYGTGNGSYSGDLKKLTDGEIALKECSDVVYNHDYIYPDGSNNAEEQADVATVVYPDGSTETVAVGSAITPKEFGAEGETKLYYGANNTLYKDDATEGWIFTVEGEATALADLTVTEDMAGKKIIASGVDKVYFTTEDADGTVYHTTNTAHSYLTMSGIKKSTDLTLYEDVNAEKFNFLANSSSYTVKLDLNGHTVTVKTKSHAQYVRIYIYSSKAGAHYYCEDAGGIAYATSAYIHFGDDGTGSYVNNISFHTPIITKGNNYHVYVIGGHYYQTEATSAFLDMTRYLKELKNATFYLYPGTAAVLAADETFSGAAVKHGDIATGTVAVNNCTFYSADGNIPVLYSTTGATPKFTNCKFYGVAATAGGTNGTVTADNTNTVNANAFTYNTVTWPNGKVEYYVAADLAAAKAFVETSKYYVDPATITTPYGTPGEDNCYYYVAAPHLSIVYDDAFNASYLDDAERVRVYYTVEVDGVTTYHTDASTATASLRSYLNAMDPGAKITLWSDVQLEYVTVRSKQLEDKATVESAQFWLDINGYEMNITGGSASTVALVIKAQTMYIYSSRESGVINTGGMIFFQSDNDQYTNSAGTAITPSANVYIGEATQSATRQYCDNLTVICGRINTDMYGKSATIQGGTYIQSASSIAPYFLVLSRTGDDKNAQVQNVSNATFILTNPTTAPLWYRSKVERTFSNCIFISPNQTDGVPVSASQATPAVGATFSGCTFINVLPIHQPNGQAFTYTDCKFGTTSGLYSTANLNLSYGAQYLAHSATVSAVTVNGVTYTLDGEIITDPTTALLLTRKDVGTDYWMIGATPPAEAGDAESFKDGILYFDPVFDYGSLTEYFENGKVIAAGEVTIDVVFESSKVIMFTYRNTATDVLYMIDIDECPDAAAAGEKFYELFNAPDGAYEIVLYQDMLLSKAVGFGALTTGDRPYHNSLINGDIILDIGGKTLTIAEDLVGIEMCNSDNGGYKVYACAVFGLEGANNRTFTIRSSAANGKILNLSSCALVSLCERDANKVVIEGENLTINSAASIVVNSEIGGKVVGEVENIVSDKAFEPGSLATNTQEGVSHGYGKLTDGDYNYQTGCFSTVSTDSHQCLDGYLYFGGTYRLDEIQIFDLNGETEPNKSVSGFVGTGLLVEVLVDGVWVKAVEAMQSEYASHRVFTSATESGSYLAFSLSGIVAEGIRVYIPERYGTGSVSVKEIKVMGVKYAYDEGETNRDNIFEGFTGASTTSSPVDGKNLSTLFDAKTDSYIEANGASLALILDFGGIQRLGFLRVYEEIGNNLLAGAAATASDSTKIEVQRDGVWYTVYTSLSLSDFGRTAINMMGIDCTALRITFTNTRLFDGESSYRSARISEISCITAQPVDRTALLEAYAALENFDTAGVAELEAIKRNALALFLTSLQDIAAPQEKVDRYTAEIVSFTEKLSRGQSETVTVNEGHSCSFQNDISLNYYIPASDLDGHTRVFLVIERDRYVDGVLTCVKTIIEDYTVVDGNLRFVYRGIAACEMGDLINATLYSFKDGQLYTVSLDEYSVKTYAYNRLAASTNAAFKTLLVDLLNYGAAAQQHFGYDTENPVNADLTDEQKALATDEANAESIERTESTVEGAIASIDGRSVVFNSNVELKYYIRFAEGTDVSALKLVLTYTTATGIEKRVEISGSDFVYVDAYKAYSAKCVDIAAADMSSEIYATVCSGTTPVSNTEVYSIESYVANRLAASASETFKALITEMYKYSTAAAIYWGEATVTVKYVKDDGTLIKTEQLTDKLGTEYSFKSPTVDGYYTRDIYVKGTLKKNTSVKVIYSRIPQNADPEHISSILPGIVCWGDSLTAGVGHSYVTIAHEYGIDLEALGSTALGGSYVDVLRNLIKGKVAAGIDVTNCGVSGETSAVIAARAMTESYYLYIGKDVTVGSGESVVIDIQQYSPEGRLGILRQGEGNSVNVVTIIGKDSQGRDVEVKGTISVKLRDGATGSIDYCDYSDLVYTFTRKDSGETATLPVGAKIVTYGSYAYDGDWCVIFIGQNGGYTSVSELIAQQQEILDACECDSNYIIIGLSSGNAAERAEMEAAMTDHWGSHYFSARAALSSENAYKEAGFSDSVIEANRASINAGKASDLFLYDGLHMNSVGYALLGNSVFARMVELGYFNAVFDYYDSLK